MSKKYEVGDTIEHKGKKGRVTQIVKHSDKICYLVKFEDETEAQISVEE